MEGLKIVTLSQIDKLASMITDEQWASLNDKLDGILRNQSYLNQKVLQIQSQLERLSPATERPTEAPKVIAPPIAEPIVAPIEDKKEERIVEISTPKVETPTPKPEMLNSKAEPPMPEAKPTPVVAMEKPTEPPLWAKKSDWERFIGGNLFNKIGIGIILIGMFIGVKYSIDHDLISPVMRILLGYLTAGALFGVGYYLKPKYEKFSAVLVSGAMAAFYFLTYVAYDFYGMFPIGVAFALMVGITGATIRFALSYNQQVIALIGMVGGYAVPFLLSTGGGHVWVLLTYVAFINVGILILSFYKQWRWLYHSAYFFTWLLYLSLHVMNHEQNQGMYFSFLCLYFLIFHFAFIARKWFSQDTFSTRDILILLSNTLLFYGLGLSFSFEKVFTDFRSYPTLFTLANALFHFAIYYYTRSRKASQQLKYLNLILSISFATLTIPIYFEGNWTTFLWAMEAGGLFWVGRVKQIRLYELISYVLLPLATLSLWDNWAEMEEQVSYEPEQVKAFLNMTFLNSVVYSAIVAGISYINSHHREKANEKFDYIINILLFVILYATFYIEIYDYWQIRINLTYREDTLESMPLYNLECFQQMWLLVYTMAYMALFSWIDRRYVQKEKIMFYNLISNLVLIFLMLTGGLYLLSELREFFLSDTPHTLMPVAIRYIALSAFGLLSWQTYKLLQSEAISFKNKKSQELVLCGVILWVASSEWLHWSELLSTTANYKLGLSILWVLYGVVMLVQGIRQSKKYLRIASIGLILFTLLKLFFYDIAHLSTLSKVVVLVILGVLLMIASFLYAKYDKKIQNSDK